MKNKTHKPWQQPARDGELEDALKGGVVAPQFSLQQMDEICCGAKPDGICPLCRSPIMEECKHHCEFDN